MKQNILVLLAFCALLLACNNSKSQEEIPKKDTGPENWINDIHSTIEDVVEFDSVSLEEYSIIKKEDLSYQGIKRNQIRATIDPGLSKKQIENIINWIIYNDYKEKKPDGTSVLIFENGDNTNGSYTVAMAEFTPTGKWEENVKNVPLERYKLNIQFIDSYFSPKPTVIDKGSKVLLSKEKRYDKTKKKFVKAYKVPISNDARAWENSNIIIRVPNNSNGEIIDIYKEKLVGGSSIIRYKVKVNYNGNIYSGWVHEDEAIIKK